MIARPVWLPLLLLAARAWALQQGHNDDSAQAVPTNHLVKLGDQVAELFHRSPLGNIADAIAPGAVAPRSPLQTPPPPPPRLRARQVDGQVAALSSQIQALSLASSSVSQASRLVSQTSQQLAQQVTQLSQSTDRLTQSIFQLQASAQAAQQSAQQASQAAQQASQSAQQEQQAAQRASQSASSAISAAITSAQSSASSMIAAASGSALKLVNAAASQAQSAQAIATGARADANSQVQSAQGTAVSVTQAAVAIVVTFFVSSLLTIIAFYLLLRHRTKQKRRRTQLIATRGTEFGKEDDTNRNGNAGAYGYPVDLKNPPSRRAVGTDNNNAASGSSDNPFDDRDEEKRRPSSDYRPREDRDSSSDVVFASAVRINKVKIVDNSPTRPRPSLQPPSLQQWLSEGTVSPFGTLRREDSTSDSTTIGQAITSGPGDAQVRPMIRRPTAGSVNGRVMQPGKTLPFRNQ